MQYVRFIYGYMGVAGFSIFFFLTGVIVLQLLEKMQARLDVFSFLFVLYNFAVRSPSLAMQIPSTSSFSLHVVYDPPLPQAATSAWKRSVASDASTFTAGHKGSQASTCLVGLIVGLQR